MPALVRSAALRGIDVIPVEVEVDVLPGLPSFSVVGLTDRAIQESRERMTSALTTIGFTPPRRKTIVSLAPASLKKEGSLYDVPITLGFLIASRQINMSHPTAPRAWFIGEVGLDGSIRPVRGVLPIVLAAAKAGATAVYIPAGNSREAAAVADEVTVYAVDSLQQLVDHLADTAENHAKAPRLKPLESREVAHDFPEPDVDFADIKGQDHAKRALLVAAAAGHNVLLIGPPGTGKTLLARALSGILPPLSREESHVVTSLYSIAGLLADEGLIRRRPFRSPHHGASSASLVGGGTFPKPGEVSLAHNGVLFLDELPEFSRHVLDQLRQPIEDGVVTVSRAAHTLRFPARSMLIGAMNPCKCGFSGSARKECRCSAIDILRYQQRVSGPLLDRFDLHVLVADVPIDELLTGEQQGMRSREYAARAAAARVLQWRRQGKTNAELTVRELKKHIAIDLPIRQLLSRAEQHFHLSARGVHRLLKVARTIADLTGRDQMAAADVAEALQYREHLRATLPEFV